MVRLIAALLLALWLLLVAGVRAEGDTWEHSSVIEHGRTEVVGSNPTAPIIEEEISTQQAIEMAIQQWWPESEWENAWCIIGRESTWRPWVVSPTGDYGLFQLNRIHAASYDWGRILEIDFNVAAAHDLWTTNDWRPWSTRHLCGV